MARYVNADEVHKMLKTKAIDEFDIDQESGYADFLKGLMYADDVVTSIAPSIDIVRCKDCRFYYEGENGTLCTLFFEPTVTDKDWFCAGGKSKYE